MIYEVPNFTKQRKFTYILTKKSKMKKITFVAVTTITMLVVSCSKSMSPEAAKAWINFKATSEKISTPEAAAQFESYEDFNVVVQEWNAAAQEMKKYATEYSKEIADSMDAIANAVSENIQFIIESQEADNGLAETVEE